MTNPVLTMKKPPDVEPAKGRKFQLATLRQLNLLLIALLSVAGSISVAAEDVKPAVFPGFRHVDIASAAAEPSSGEAVILLADQDFAPWSFLDAEGRLQGISVELAQKACADAGLSCDIQPKAFTDMMPALKRSEAQGVVSGPKLDAQVAAEFALTRPYFQTLGRFVVRSGSPLSAPDIRTLAGRRVGFRANSAHARFLETYYSRSALTPFEASDAMMEALRTGQVDTVFGDAVQLSYWLKGAASKACCTFLGKAFLDRNSFTRSLSFVLRRDDLKLRVKFDDALDHLESKGETAEVFASYLPASLW